MSPTKELNKLDRLYRWLINIDKVDDFIRWYDNTKYKFITNPIFQVKRLYQWYVNVFYNDFDFDARSLFGIIEYKLKRIEECLINGRAVQEPKDLKAIRLAIKLAGRLKDDKYYMNGYDRIEKKFGKLNSWFEPCNDGSTNSFWRSSRPKVITDEDKKQEREYHKLQYELSSLKMKRETKWLYSILANHLRSWWD